MTSIINFSLLQACFYVLKAASSAFTERISHLDSPSSPLWLSHVLSLYAAAANATATASPFFDDQFDFDLLASFAAIAPAVTRACCSFSSPLEIEQCRGLIGLILSKASSASTTTASSSSSSSNPFNKSERLLTSEEEEEDDAPNVVEAAADAVRALLSSPDAVQGVALEAGTLQVLDTMLEQLMTSTATHDSQFGAQASRRRRVARHHLISGLIHVVHAEQSQAAAAAETILRARVLQPLMSISSFVTASVVQLSMLHAMLGDVQVVLDALQSHADVVVVVAATGRHQQPATAAVGAVGNTVAACLDACPKICALQ